jgi:hypothetical protein
MSTANFAVIIFEEHLGLPQKHRGSHVDDLDDDGRTYGTTYPADIPFVGPRSTLHTFEIDANPEGPAYMIVRTYNQTDSGHHVYVNGNQLTIVPPYYQALARASSLLVQKDNLLFLDSKVLRPQTNSVEIAMGPESEDDFVVECVVVHWHEQPFTPPTPEG